MFLVVLLMAFLSACATSQKTKPVYLSSERTVDRLIDTMKLNEVGSDLHKGFKQSENESGDNIAVKLDLAYSAAQLQFDFREYLLASIPEENVLAWIEYYSTDFQQKVILLEETHKNYTEDDAALKKLKEIKADKKMMKQLVELVEAIKLDQRMRTIMYDGILKPMIYGAAIIQSPGATLDQSQLEKAINTQLNAMMPEVLEATQDASYYTYSFLTEQERERLLSHYRSPVADFLNNSLVAAIGESLSKASQRYVNSMSKEYKTYVQAAKFDTESCLKIKGQHNCEILSISAVVEKQSLYHGGSLVGKSGRYRLMAPNSDWQLLKIGSRYTDDLVITRKDGEAMISLDFVVGQAADVNTYTQQVMGDIAKTLKTEPWLVDFDILPGIESGEVYELCYEYFEVEVCKLAGGGNINGDAVYLTGFLVKRDKELRELISIFQSLEPIKAITMNE